MAVYATDKAALAAMIEATQEVLNQLGEKRLEQSGPAADRGAIASVYGVLRRVKSHLQRCFLPQAEQAQLDLDATEMPLLAACCARGAELAETRAETSTDQRDQEWARRQRDLLADQAVMLATGPLPTLPLPGISPLGTAIIRGVRARLRQKFAPAPAAFAAADQHAAEAKHVHYGTDNSAPAARSGLQMVAVSRGASQESPASVADSEGAQDIASRPGILTAPPRLQNPQLRAFAAMDFRALARAEAASDYRAASVHLASLLESAVIDTALARAAELHLTGRPEAWDMADVAARLIGDRCSARDRSMLSFIFEAQRLVRPAQQLEMPLVVTPGSYQSHCEFVAVVLRMLGCNTTPQ